jgi:hypothetical protein
MFSDAITHARICGHALKIDLDRRFHGSSFAHRWKWQP